MRAEGVERVVRIVEITNPSPGSFTVDAACCETALVAFLAVSAVVAVTACGVLRVEPQRQEALALPPHRQATSHTATVNSARSKAYDKRGVTAAWAHLSKDMAKELTTPCSSTRPPLGTCAKLTEVP